MGGRLRRAHVAIEKFIICNGDEGDPGAYMDRTVLESDPHSVIEGMIIGAYAVARPGLRLHPGRVSPGRGAGRGGHRTGRGAGACWARTFSAPPSAFRSSSCGGAARSSAVRRPRWSASIEGGLGEPRPKPPYPAEAGLWGQPTVINNVKTWATVPVVLARGAEWYASQGCPGNAGTVVFSLVGQIANTGLVEVPLGTKLGVLLQGIGGGGAGRATARVAASRPCRPAGLRADVCRPRLDFLSIDYESMKAAGSIMGSGGMVVLDETACMVDVARYFLDFTRAESCGKCTACPRGYAPTWSRSLPASRTGRAAWVT